jgi:hypothetical protein
MASKKEFTLKNIKAKNMCLKAISVMLIAACVLVVTASFASAALTASTSMTIVHVTNYMNGTVPSMSTWEGDWPNDSTDQLNPGYREVYLYNVHFDTHHMSWSTIPAVTPYPVFPNTISSMIAAVWSKDRGKSFVMLSWDYLASTTRTRNLEGGMPDCWMGTMIHSVCDRKAGECNGRYKSNLNFTEYPSGNTSCWGTVD